MSKHFFFSDFDKKNKKKQICYQNKNKIYIIIALKAFWV